MNIDEYINQLFVKYIISIQDKKNRNIAIIDGENLLGYYKLKNTVMTCLDTLFNPILDLLSQVNAIDQNSLLIIIHKRDKKLFQYYFR